MIKYKSIGSYIHDKLGKIYFVECDKERSRDGDCDGLAGSNVIIDDKEYKVKGVERNMPAFPIKKGERIGLLV